MTIRGKVRNGVVVVENPRALPEGAEVSVRVLKKRKGKRSSKRQPPSLAQRLRRFIGKAKGLPPDASVNLDHYLYALPKKK